MIRCPKWSELFVFCSRLGVKWHTIALMSSEAQLGTGFSTVGWSQHRIFVGALPGV